MHPTEKATVRMYHGTTVRMYVYFWVFSRSVRPPLSKIRGGAPACLVAFKTYWLLISGILSIIGLGLVAFFCIVSSCQLFCMFLADCQLFVDLLLADLLVRWLFL